MRTGAQKKKDETGNRKSVSLRGSNGRLGDRKVARYRLSFYRQLAHFDVADNTSSEVGHGESWPENPWQTVKKKQYKVQC
jgi:hypothetical protein